MGKLEKVPSKASKAHIRYRDKEGNIVPGVTTILGIIFIFALITLLLGKAFDMSLLQTISFVIINTSMFFLVYSLVSKKGIGRSIPL